MPEKPARGPSAKPKSKVASYFSLLIDASEMNQREIARALGLMPNYVSMMKTGESKIPIQRVPDICKLLHGDKFFLFKLIVEEYDSENRWAVIHQIFDFVPYENEIELLRLIREKTGDTNPKLVSYKNQKQLDDFINSL